MKADNVFKGRRAKRARYVRCGYLILIALLLTPAVEAADMERGEILQTGEMKQKYQLTAENRPVIHLDTKQVPDDLRDLIPVAEKWGISDDIMRSDFQANASQEEKAALKAALAGRNKRITQWLDSFSGDKPMTDEAAAFMYMQLSLDEMGLWLE